VSYNHKRPSLYERRTLENQGSRLILVGPLKDWSPRSRTSNPCSRSPVAPPPSGAHGSRFPSGSVGDGSGAVESAPAGARAGRRAVPGEGLRGVGDGATQFRQECQNRSMRRVDSPRKCCCVRGRSLLASVRRHRRAPQPARASDRQGASSSWLMSASNAGCDQSGRGASPLDRNWL
jgi:hypothetical protein